MLAAVLCKAVRVGEPIETAEDCADTLCTGGFRICELANLVAVTAVVVVARKVGFAARVTSAVSKTCVAVGDQTLPFVTGSYAVNEFT